MTKSELRDVFLTRLVREAGGNRRRWRLVVGEVRLYSRATHSHCNWSVTPAGSAAENDAVERVSDDLRQRHPIVQN